jgi:hypothetical protein
MSKKPKNIIAVHDAAKRWPPQPRAAEGAEA